MTGVESNLSTAYHPQTDGQTERINQEVEQYLRIFVNERQTDWYDWLPSASFSYNDKTHSSTGYSPFYINHGMHPYKGTNPRTEYKSQSAKDFVDEIKKVRLEAESALKQTAETMKKFYNRKKGDSREYSIGDKVWLEGTNITTTRPSKKLGDKQYGPFVIEKKEGRSAYRLTLPPTWKKIHPVFNESLLTPYRNPEYPSQQQPDKPPPVIVNDVAEFEVEEILDS